MWPANEYDINLNVKAFPSQRLKYFGSPRVHFYPAFIKKLQKFNSINKVYDLFLLLFFVMNNIFWLLNIFQFEV